MTRKTIGIFSLILVLLVASCASIPKDRYNTQKGAVIGAGLGALLGQAIGGNTEGTLIGLGAGTLLGALVGNAVDQSYDAAREAARTNKKVVYYDKHGSAVEAIPEGYNQQTNCDKITKRVWKNGKLISENVEEICEEEKRSRE